MPESFVARKPLNEMLGEQTKDDLVLLIQEMIDRYPELEMLIDRPAPVKSSPGAPVDASSYSRELHQTMRHYGGWADRSAERAVRSVVKSTGLFASKGEWGTARAIYSTVHRPWLLS